MSLFLGKQRVIPDPVFGPIEVDPITRLFMDHRYVQRLRNTRHLDLVYLSTPSANQSRFEHCLGTYHLVKQFVRKLECDLITPNEAQCVAIVAMCHDLGRDPFSHAFRQFVMQNKFDQNSNWNHKEVNMVICHQIIQDIKKSFNADDPSADTIHEFFGFKDTESNENIKLLYKLIVGPSYNAISKSTKTRIGLPADFDFKLPPEKEFLHEIVNNDRWEFDLHRLDRLIRDAYYLKTGYFLNFSKCISMLYIVTLSDGRKVLGIRDKQVGEFLQIVSTRRMHIMQVYKHRKTNAFEIMIVDALKAYWESESKETPFYKLLEFQLRNKIPDDIDFLCSLGDGVLLNILEQNANAFKFVKRIHERSVYRHLISVSKSFSADENEQLKKSKTEIQQKIVEFNNREDHKDKVVVTLTLFSYKNLVHPLRHVHFCTKEDVRSAKDNGNNIVATPYYDEKKHLIKGVLADKLMVTSKHLSVIVVRLYSKEHEIKAEIRQSHEANLKNKDFIPIFIDELQMEECFE